MGRARIPFLWGALHVVSLLTRCTPQRSAHPPSSIGQVLALLLTDLTIHLTGTKYDIFSPSKPRHPTLPRGGNRFPSHRWAQQAHSGDLTIT